MNFLFDTANDKFIDEALTKMDGRAMTKCWGVTTNPNAFAKLGIKRLADWRHQVKLIRKVLVKHGLDDAYIHVQFPHSYFAVLNPDLIHEFEDYLKDPYLVIKLGPYPVQFRKRVTSISNITGITSGSIAALMCGFDSVAYVSLIPGRMEAEGIERIDQHMKFACALAQQTNKNVIAGSMRSLEDCRKYAAMGAIPTIGEKVFESVGDYNEFLEDVDKVDLVASIEPPTFTQAQKNLSSDFFYKMNELADTAWTEFQEYLK